MAFEDAVPFPRRSISWSGGNVYRRNDYELHPALREFDPSTRFLYRPHTITCLLLGLSVLVYASGSFSSSHPSSPEAAYLNAKHGVWACVLVYLGYAFLQGPKTCMVRPHPAVWRIVHALLVVYLLFFIFLLFQTPDDARHFLKHLHNQLGTPLEERSYGNDCRLWIPGTGMNWSVIFSTLFDEFVLAHTVGWWVKALVVRNYTLLWVLSIGFELLELTFSHMLPNFNECWWDSWVLDVAVCNLAGMVVGMKTVRYFEAKEYNWTGISRQPSLYAKVVRGVLQFTPYSFDTFDWRPTSSPLRLLQCLIPAALFLGFELNAFFLKFVLWVPPRNPLNTWRLLILALGAIPAFREYYLFIQAEKDPFNKLGVFAWLTAAIGIVESLCVIKFGRGMFPNPWPARVLWTWGIVGCVCVPAWTIWAVHYYFMRRKSARKLD